MVLTRDKKNTKENNNNNKKKRNTLPSIEYRFALES